MKRRHGMEGKRVLMTAKGFDGFYEFESLSSAARAVGRSKATVKARIKDGYVLFTDRNVPVHVYYADGR